MKQKSIWCPSCGHLLEEGEINQCQESIEINHTFLDDNGRLNLDWHDTIHRDINPTYYCCGCWEDLKKYHTEDIVNIYKRIQKYETEYKKNMNLKSLYGHEELFNTWLKLHNYE